MQSDVDPQQDLKTLGQILETLTGELTPLFRHDSAQVAYWRRSLEAVAASLQEQTLRIAVVGSVKAGKSTFINAIQGRDLLKRGAGIITAFITRIRSGAQERGWVEIKSWAEINAELNEALALVGLPSVQEGMGSLDLRQESDRRALQGVLDHHHRFAGKRFALRQQTGSFFPRPVKATGGLLPLRSRSGFPGLMPPDQGTRQDRAVGLPTHLTP